MTVTYIREIMTKLTQLQKPSRKLLHMDYRRLRKVEILFCYFALPSRMETNQKTPTTVTKNFAVTLARNTVSNNPLAAQKLKGEGGLESNIMTTNMREEEVIVICTQISPGLWSKTFGFGVFTSSWLGIELE